MPKYLGHRRIGAQRTITYLNALNLIAFTGKVAKAINPEICI